METLLHSYILLASDASVLETDMALQELDKVELDYGKKILSGQSCEVIQEILNDIGATIDIQNVDLDEEALLQTLRNFITNHLVNVPHRSLLLAISLLQVFIQNNYTGPPAPLDWHKVLLKIEVSDEVLHSLLVSSLSVLGQPAYDLMDSPFLLVFALLIFEQLTNQPTTFENNDDTEEPSMVTISSSDCPSLVALAHWWRARALLAQLSLLPEVTGLHPAVVASILSSIELAHAVVKDLPESVSEDFKKSIYTIYYLENVKCSLAINTEQFCLQSLIKVKKLTNFNLVLTGARAKRTKFQQKGHAGLLILAQSNSFVSNQEEEINDKNLPENFDLNSDLLLEKPHFEAIGSEPLDEQIVKKQKTDQELDIEEDKLLPLAIRQEYIPAELKALDPNNQPPLSNYDNIQLLLRLYVIRQTTPYGDALVEQELTSIAARILYQGGAKNWTIFSRCLWERSVIETTKAKTIERGLLQMQSLVEELGLQITTRLLPQSKDTEALSPILRLKYIHQLPFFPRWKLDATLAEKYMSCGILRSAVEIYERLGMSCEAALCHAAVGDERQAEKILRERVERNPKDARAYSILGDINQDPELWLKSWEIGKYVNAKNSLAKYYYNPPSNSGLTRDYAVALKHLNDSLRRYTLNFQTWYFYGCIGLECGQMNLAAEAFSRCISLDENHSMAWSNLSAAYIESNKLKEAFSCLKRAISSDAQKNWRIWENYMIVAVKLNEWDDVLTAVRQLVTINRERTGEKAIDLPVVEKLVELLVSTDYPSGDEKRTTHFQRTCTEFICNTLPSLITTSDRCWRLVAKVELWRKRPWAALECHEKAYRAVYHNPEIEIDEQTWDTTVSACEDLVAAYESLGEIEGKYGDGSMVCKDWKYRSRSTIKALMSKGKNRWDGSDGWERLMELRSQV